MENKENKSFEELLNELSTIVKELESGSLSLEDSVAKYQQGISLSVECKKRLDEARNVVVTKMTENAEELFK
jgi:exodeoxyribonuclease VII small subunit